jgi:FkbM family methyltransferase
VTEFKGHADQKFGHITYSQSGEDLMILNLCKMMGLDKPSYLDIGAHHPINISNTALLYERGSRGVNVEANPNLMGAFYEHRPLDVNLNFGVVITTTQSDCIPFYLVDKYSGLNSFLSESIEAHGFQWSDKIYVPTITIMNLIHDHCNDQFPDILFTDIEGLDAAVLDSSLVKESHPKIVCSELRHDARAIEMMERKGFTHYCCMGENDIFIWDGYID